MVRVLSAENSAPFHAAQLDHLHACLPPAVIDAAQRYKRWQDAQAFLWGRYLLMKGLSDYGFEKNHITAIQYTTYKRPYLPIPLDFNISHSGNYIVCAFSKHQTGVDIEAVRPVDIQDFTSCFSTRELAVINNATDMYNEFFRHWTIKEAAIKADGRGLSIPLETISVADEMTIEGNTWYIYPIDVAPGYQSHLATNAAIRENIAVERIELPQK